MKQMIIKMDEEQSIETLPAEIVGATYLANAHSYYNKLLVLAMSKLTIEEVEALEQVVEVDDGIEVTPYNFKVLAIQGEQIVQEPILNFIDDKVVMVDEEMSSEPVTDITGKLQTFAGKKWNY